MKNSKDLAFKLLRFIPAFIIISISWYLSDQETIEQMPDFFGADKVVHFICYGGLCFWFAFGLKIKAFQKIILPVIFTSFYGIIDEIHQSYTPGRSASVFDWMADTAGAVIGAVVFVILFKLLLQIKNRS